MTDRQNAQLVTGGIFYCRDSAGFSASASNKLSFNLTGQCFEIGNKNIPPNVRKIQHNKMKNMIFKKTIIIVLLFIFSQNTFSQTYPTFGPEKKVAIEGLTFDAMEPFISLDGNTLFFNSLNSGGNTNLYYATKVNDTTFTYAGMVGGTYDPSPNHLDAVASIDSLNNFFWTSLRSIPNLYRGNYLMGNVSNISKVYGDFNILSSGWIIMDAAVNYQGDLLYYTNAYFGPTYTECIGVPCIARLGVAQRVNDSTFNKTSNTDAVFSNVNDTNYIIYAPQVTKDGLELFFTRLLKGGYNTEICFSVRNTSSDNFSLPMVVYSNYGYFPEAASPTTNKQIIYYHQKDETGFFHIYLRYRTGSTGIYETDFASNLQVFPNPVKNILNVILPDPAEHFTISVTSLMGQELYKTNNSTSIDISSLSNGIYFLTIRQNDINRTVKIVKE